MTRNSNFGQIRKILATTCALLFIVCSFAFGLTACKDIYEPSDPTYSYSEEESVDEIFTNSSFSNGMKDIDVSKYPYSSSTTNWAITADNSASSSAVGSGVVNISESGFKSTLANLIDDSDFVNYLNNKYGFKATVVDSIKQADSSSDVTESTLTTEQMKEYFSNHSSDFFANPGKYSTTADDYVYMLNNYTANANYLLGTAQKVSSSQTATVSAGSIYKISVWLKTVNITGHNTEYGANIRVTNSFAGNTQAPYIIKNIIANDWTQYTVYVTADKDYDCSISLAFGLGVGNGSANASEEFVEGTLFVDDIAVEEVDEIPSGITEDTMVYGNKTITSTANANNVYAYNMNATFGTTFNPSISASNLELTKSNVSAGASAITSKTFDSTSDATLSSDAGVTTITLTKSSATLTLESSDFSVTYKNYYYLSFYIKNNLSAFGSQSITFDIVDEYNTVKSSRAAVYTLDSTNDGEWTKVALIFKNNFEATTRKFTIKVIIGPADVLSVEHVADFASGTVSIKDFRFATGSIDSDTYADGTDDNEYKKYLFLVSNANANVNLYAGYSADYSEADSTTETYSISPAPGNIGEIVSQPTNANGYDGITSNHIYINEKTEENASTISEKINTRSGDGDANGNIAGLINTKYISNYDAGIVSAITGAYTDNIQPLVIYNEDGSAYGFIGASQTISGSSYAKVSAKIRVVDKDSTNKATAYIYIVDTSKANKNVEELTVNGQSHLLQLAITSDMMEDGWTTVSFYIATGSSSKNLRVEIWNGDRDGANSSYGYVFIDEITVETSSAFTEASSTAKAFGTQGTVLTSLSRDAFANDGELIAYTRTLTSTEIEFNEEYPDDAVSYSSNYVWAKNDNVVYAIYNTIDPVEVDPYENIEEEESSSGCAANTDPSTFWMSFSSILLAAVLLLAIIALIVKRTFAKKKANRSDARVNYKVKSRITTHKENLKIKESKEEPAFDEDEEEVVEDEAIEEQSTEEEPATEETTEEKDLDSYVYGDVQDFGNAETNEDKPEDNKE